VSFDSEHQDLSVVCRKQGRVALNSSQDVVEEVGEADGDYQGGFAHAFGAEMLIAAIAL